MLSYSAQSTFVLTLFMLVLSGLSFLLLLWIEARDRHAGSPRARRILLLGFSLLIVAFGARAFDCWLALCARPAGGGSSFMLQFVSESAKLLAGCALLSGLLLQGGRAHRVWLVGGLTSACLLLSVLRFSSDAALRLDSIVPLTTARGADVAVLGAGLLLIGRSRGWLPPIAVALLPSTGVMAAVALASPNLSELAWAGEHLLTLTSLVLLAVVNDRQNRHTLLSFFLRLNLAFLVLATSLILTMTEIERRQFVEFAALHTQDVAEFVRGHTLYYSGRGEAPEDVLDHADVIRKLVAEFGRYPDLRRVQVSLQGRTMALEIDPDGVIAQHFTRGDPRRPPPVSPADFAVAPLLEVPILRGGRPIGRVELDHSLQRINEQIGWQMLVIFAVFTLSVMVASAVTGILVWGADRTIRRQYEELERTRRRLSLSERLASIGAVADGVAHEINNPAGILVARTDYLHAAVRGSPLYADIADDLDTIQRQAQRIAKTVKDLLTFTHPSPVRTDTVDLAAVLDSAIQLVRPLVTERAITLECSCDPELPPLRGDRNRLEQVFINLLVNAVQAIPDRGTITLTASAPPSRDRVEVVVRDTGVGIAPEHLVRIFDPFFTTKEPGSGTGLGLSIAYGIIRDHGGAIDVVSTTGRGTEFRVTLPSAHLGPSGVGQPSQAVDTTVARASNNLRPELAAPSPGRRLGENR